MGEDRRPELAAAHVGVSVGTITGGTLCSDKVVAGNKSMMPATSITGSVPCAVAASIRAYSSATPGLHTLTAIATQSDNSTATATGNFEVVGITANNGRTAKNIIIMLGDGMGAAHRTAARIMAKGYAQGKAQGKLAMDSFPVTGMVMTASLNSIVTDSAPDMANYVNGNKAQNNQEGVFPDDTTDVDGHGALTGTFHWIDATATYGPVKVISDPDNALSLDNVLANDNQPIIVSFSTPVNITRFSIAQDNSGLGTLATNGTYLAFLDASGHEIAGANVYYTQYGNLGLTIQNLAPVSNVSGVLLAGGRNYDNMYVNAVPVPEPEAWVMLSGGLLLMGATARRRRR